MDVSVSVVIPVRDRSAVIGRAVESVLRQSFPAFEVIVVDDGSTDSPGDTLRLFEDPRIRFLVHPRNQGPAAARNTGIRSSRGSYIAFLDSDDEWDRRKLEKQVALLENSPADHAFACCGYRVATPGLGEYVVSRAPVDLRRELHFDCALGPGSTLILRRTCLDGVGMLDERFRRLEDWDWLLRLSVHYRMAFISEPLVSVWKSDWPSADLFDRNVNLFLLKHEKEFRRLGTIHWRRVTARHLLRVARSYYSEQNIAQGNRCLLSAIRQYPFQNPIRILGVLQSLIDALTGLKWSEQSIYLKRRILKR